MPSGLSLPLSLCLTIVQLPPYDRTDATGSAQASYFIAFTSRESPSLILLPVRREPRKDRDRLGSGQHPLLKQSPKTTKVDDVNTWEFL